MNRLIFQYLRKKGFTDTHKVNSLFVSAYVKHNGWDIRQGSFLSQYILDWEDGELKEFEGKLIRYDCNFTFEDLTKLFEFVISPEDRVITGAIYTPKEVRELIVSSVLSRFDDEKLESIKVGDISCGCGSFLIDTATAICARTRKSLKEVIEDQIFGFDIQQYSVERTKIMLSLLAVSKGEVEDIDFNVFQADSVVYDFKAIDALREGFDAIVGNPPYVCSRNMSAEVKANLGRWRVCSTGHPDLYIPFFQIALENLCEEGVLGYITMNSFIKSLNGRALRQYFQDWSYSFDLIDFRSRQIFGSKSTYTCICLIQKTPSENIRYSINEDNPISAVPEYREVPYIRLDAIKGWNLNNISQSTELEQQGIPLGRFCQSRHGIATLSNKTYIFKPVREDEGYYYFIKDGAEEHVEKGICRDIVNSNRMTKEVVFEDVLEKVIFPYTNEDHPAVIDEAYFRQTYPAAYAYLEKCRPVLEARDKGKGKDYPHWYEFGRTQCLNRIPAKLFFPKLASHSPVCVLSDDADLLFYNGQAFISDNVETLQVVKDVLESASFWGYVTTTSKPYCSNYYCLNGNYIKNFGVNVKS